MQQNIQKYLVKRKRGIGEIVNEDELTNIPSKKKRKYIHVNKAISGGQTGADRGGLEAAKELGIQTGILFFSFFRVCALGGTAPKGYWTENGKDVTLKNFGLSEISSKHILANYVERSIRNVDDSDGTIVFRIQDSIGTDKTIGYCQTKKWKKGEIRSMDSSITGHKPVCIITDVSDVEKASETIRCFLLMNNLRCINVCGHRQSSVKGMNFQNRVKEIMIKALAS